ncbi:DNA internalization-related competence protein ComEC/Rec2, partial [Vibrio sp. M260118]|uniref:DNA internalization-related competence protein ComEC/Rec2 n=1 Tax=Vibrio sp. M260118 TaxID=3020896 RepID=UPI002F4079B8
ALACVVILMHGNLLRYQTEMLFQAGRDITIIADVDSLFRPINFGFQGIVVVRSINGEALTTLNQPKIRLNSPTLLNLGDQLSAHIKIKPIVGLMNDVGYDAELHALSQGIVGIGSITPKQSYFVVSNPSVRMQMISSVQARTESLEHRAMVLALLFGIRDDISQQTWQQLKQSGLSHLIAISGLHVGIAFAIGWALGIILARVHRLLLYSPILLGLTLALCYAWLAGFSIPTQRALVMCILLCFLQQLAGHLPSLYKWLLVLAVLLCFDPFAAASASLWMSMIAVGILLFYQGIRTKRGYFVVDAIKVQLFLIVFMAPLVIYLFHGVSIGAVFYNLIFVPWFSLVVIPLVFVAFSAQLLLESPMLPWWGLDRSLALVQWAMNYSEWGWSDVSRQTLTCLMIGILLLFLNRVVSKRYLTLLAVCIGLGISNWREAPLWRLVVLDVGHGLSVVVQQGERALLYDTGAAWNTSSIAEQIITPWMISHGINNLDYFAISHFDNDHAGGADQIKAKWQPRTVITSQWDHSVTPCIAGKSWQWDKVTIEAIWPPKTVLRAYNPHSCVIRLKHQASSATLLLAGDIETIAEWILVRKPGRLDSDILLVPHHGSKTSSTAAFVKAVNPEVAIASLAMSGRWALPNKTVVQRYKDAGAKWMDTGQHGQISIDFYPQTYQVTALREFKGKTWYRQMLRNRVE